MKNGVPCTVLFSIGIIGESKPKNHLSARIIAYQFKSKVDTRWHEMTQVQLKTISLAWKINFFALQTYFYFANRNVTLSPISINARYQYVIMITQCDHAIMTWPSQIKIFPLRWLATQRQQQKKFSLVYFLLERRNSVFSYFIRYLSMFTLYNY